MASETKIQWCHHTFNPWIGCTKVSPGCVNCYAAARDERFAAGVHWGPGAERSVTGRATWRWPVKWAVAAAAAGVRRRVFCASLADVFDKEAPVQARRRLWAKIMETSHALDWMLLTKRPERVLGTLREDNLPDDFLLRQRCWLGCTIEAQPQAVRAMHTLTVDAAARFVSYEPALEYVDFRNIDVPDSNGGQPHPLDALAGTWSGAPMTHDLERRGRGFDLIIVGGESGRGARPFNIEWARQTVLACKAAGVPVFVKQMGDRPYQSRALINGGPYGSLIDIQPATERVLFKEPKGGAIEEWPADIQVREMPHVPSPLEAA